MRPYLGKSTHRWKTWCGYVSKFGTTALQLTVLFTCTFALAFVPSLIRFDTYVRQSRECTHARAGRDDKEDTTAPLLYFLKRIRNSATAKDLPRHTTSPKQTTSDPVAWTTTMRTRRYGTISEQHCFLHIYMEQLQRGWFCVLYGLIDCVSQFSKVAAPVQLLCCACGHPLSRIERHPMNKLTSLLCFSRPLSPCDWCASRPPYATSPILTLPAAVILDCFLVSHCFIPAFN